MLALKHHPTAHLVLFTMHAICIIPVQLLRVTPTYSVIGITGEIRWRDDKHRFDREIIDATLYCRWHFSNLCIIVHILCINPIWKFTNFLLSENCYDCNLFTASLIDSLLRVRLSSCNFLFVIYYIYMTIYRCQGKYYSFL